MQSEGQRSRSAAHHAPSAPRRRSTVVEHEQRDAVSLKRLSELCEHVFGPRGDAQPERQRADEILDLAQARAVEQDGAARARSVFDELTTEPRLPHARRAANKHSAGRGALAPQRGDLLLSTVERSARRDG